VRNRSCPLSFSCNHSFVWYRVAKTGTRSINQIFEEEIDDYVYLTRFSARHPQERKVFNIEHFAFTIVRNPWSRSWSAWNNKIKGCDPNADNVGARRVMSLARGDLGLARSVTESYPLFVQHLGASRLFQGDVHFMPQTSLLDGRRLDHIGRFERYAAEVEHILGRVGLADCEPKIPHINISLDGGAFLNNLDNETARILRDLYRHDVERFNYRSPFG
jgi:hypothetical protein